MANSWEFSNLLTDYSACTLLRPQFYYYYFIEFKYMTYKVVFKNYQTVTQSLRQNLVVYV